MATKGSIGLKNALSLERLKVSTTKIGEIQGIPPIDIPSRHKNLDMLRAIQLEVMADWSDQLAVSLGVPQEELSPISGLTYEERVLYGQNTQSTPVPVGTPAVTVDDEGQDKFDLMKFPEILAYAKERNIDMKGIKRKQDAIDKIKAAEAGEGDPTPDPAAKAGEDPKPDADAAAIDNGPEVEAGHEK